MTPYLFVVAFTVFIIATIVPILIGLYYEYRLKKHGVLSKKRNKTLTNLFSYLPPKSTLAKFCLFLSIFSIMVSNILMLFFGTTDPFVRDLSLFVGLWAATLIGFANYLKN